MSALVDTVPVTTVPLWEHQAEAVRFAAPRPAAMLSMPMGVGKTLTTIAIVGERGWARTLILAPKSVVPHWPREFAKFAAYPIRAVALDERKSVAQRVAQAELECARAEAAGVPLVLVTNHEAAWRQDMSSFVTKWRPECLVVDESHRGKDPFGSFSKWLGRMSMLFRQRIGLTGTPAPHSPLDLFAQYRFLDPRIFGHSFVRFRARYGVMGGFQGKVVVGFQNCDELAEKFRSIAYNARPMSSRCLRRSTLLGR